MKSILVILSLLSSALICHAQKTDTTVVKSYKGPDSTGVFVFVESPPEFPGGDAALISFLKKNIVYPKKELRKGITGKVFLKFVVDVDGTVGDAWVNRSSGSKALDQEALRVVRLLPTFKPGFQQGKAVRVYYNLPIIFKLQ